MTYAEHAAAFKAHLSDLREAIEEERYEDADPLCIDTRITKRIFLTLGGPTIFVDITLDENSKVVAGSYIYNWHPEHIEYQLSLEEAEEIASLYGITE